jgi:hypothetical protein
VSTAVCTDPWAITDHDPSSIATLKQSARPSTAATLAYARADIHDAAAQDDPHRRRQHVLAARDNAVAVLLAADANDLERRDAEHYLVEAETVMANT